uniref:Peptidase S1 domain-containing protein n=1 Tax=Poecilia mexicana TaxID=48701 RepID=A0A3B3XNF3_9TELE
MLWLCVAVSSVSLQKRIVGGQNCRDDERLYHVTVIRHNNIIEVFCGGSLISDQWVLTAGHCWESDPQWVLEAHVGVHPKSAPKKIYRITQLEVYRDRNGRYHDIMLLKLPVKVTTIQPIRLPDYLTCLRCFSSTVQDSPDDLQCAEFKIAKHEKLEKIEAKDRNFLRSYQKWYSVQSSKRDTSRGDSGGGLVFKNRLYGVLSFLGDPDYAFIEPNGFMDVCAYKHWIDDTII